MIKNEKPITIRPLQSCDEEAVWRIWQEIVEEGNAFTSDGSESEGEVLDKWFRERTSRAAIVDGEVAGVYG